MGIAEAIKLGLLLAEAATKGIAAAQEGKAFVEQLVAENREPTVEEIAQLRAVTQNLHELIQAS